MCSTAQASRFQKIMPPCSYQAAADKCQIGVGIKTFQVADGVQKEDVLLELALDSDATFLFI